MNGNIVCVHESCSLHSLYSVLALKQCILLTILYLNFSENTDDLFLVLSGLTVQYND